MKACKQDVERVARELAAPWGDFSAMSPRSQEDWREVARDQLYWTEVYEHEHA